MPLLCRLLIEDFSQGWSRLIGCEILFRILTWALFGPLIAWFVLQLIAFSGQSAISNFAIAEFILSPLGWFTLVIAVGLAWAVVFLAQAALLLIQVGQLCNKPPSLTQAVVIALRRGWIIVRLALVFVLLFTLVALPFLIFVFLIYQWLLSDFDINYYLSQQPSEFSLALALGSILAIGLLIAWSFVYARTLLALPECVLKSKKPLNALKSSFQLTRNHTWSIFKGVIGWFIVYSVLSALLLFAVQGIEFVALRAVGNSFGLMAIVIGLLLTLNLLAATLSAIFGSLSLSLLVGRLYWSSLFQIPPLYSSTGELTRPDLTGIVEMNLADESAKTRSIGNWLTPKRVLVLGTAVLPMLSLAFCLLLLSKVNYEDQVQITAHRGSSHEAPENTLSAVRQAIADGADYAEIDVQETADGVVVVMHDADFMRIAGDSRNIWQTTYADLQEIDAGRWFDESFAGERTPTLQEVIELSQGKIKLNIELKFNGHDVDLTSRTLKVVNQNDFASQCVVTSLKHESLNQVQLIDSSIPVGAIIGASIGDLTRVESDFISINVTHVDRRLIRDLHRRGKAIHVWTVNDEQMMSDMIDLGVDNIITDEPRKLIRLLDQRRQLTDAQRLLLAFRKLIEY